MNGTALLGKAVDIPLLITTKSATIALYSFFLYWWVNLEGPRRVYRKFLRTAVQLGGLTADWSENSTRISSWDSLVNVYPSSALSSLFDSVRYIGFSWMTCSLSTITNHISMSRRLPRYEVQSYLDEEGQILWPEPSLYFGIPFCLLIGLRKENSRFYSWLYQEQVLLHPFQEASVSIYIRKFEVFSIPNWKQIKNLTNTIDSSTMTTGQTIVKYNTSLLPPLWGKIYTQHTAFAESIYHFPNRECRARTGTGN